MEKTNSLNSKIKQYAALATGVTAAAGATGQVVYTDVNPDEVLNSSNTQYLLDLDNGGSADMGFIHVQGSNTGIYTYGTIQIPYTINYAGGVAAFGSSAPATNGWMGTGNDASNIPMSNMIGGSGNFVQSQGRLGVVQSTYAGPPLSGTYGPYSNGQFVGTEGYIGVRFDISGSTHYGWARVEVAPDGTSMTIKDYAYESTAGTGIQAGDMGSVNVDELAMDNLVTIINRNNNNLLVRNNGLTNGSINVVAIDGKVTLTSKVVNQTEVVDLNNLASGIYVVNVTANEGTLSKKIYVR